jgi:hypothetical protein
MPPQTESAETPRAEPRAPIPAEILDPIMRAGPLTAAEVETATRRVKPALIARALGAARRHPLGYAPGGGGPHARDRDESPPGDQRHDGAPR